MTGNVMDDSSQQYKVIDVAPLVQSKYAVLSGGKAKNGAPIMTFPDRPGQPEVSDDDYGKVVTYLCSITPLHESEAGLVIVIDRRQDSWGAVKTMLLKLSAFFPVHIQVVFLLQPKGFFQRAFADFRSKFVKEELEFKVVLCDSPKDIEDYIELGQLTTDVGGELEFDASEWAEHRSAVEKFSQNTAQISTSLSAVVKKMEERELPNDVPGTEAILRVCMAERKELFEDIDSASAHGRTLLTCIRGEQATAPLTKLCHVLELERLLVQLNESRTGFGEFWQRHEAKLKQCLVVRQFEEEFKLAQFSLERRIEAIEAVMQDLGDSVTQVESLIKDYNTLEEESQKDINQADRMRARGQQLIMEEHYAVDSIRPKCLELQRICEQYKELLRRRKEMLSKSNDLHDRLEKGSKWCNSGVDLLAGQAVDRQLSSQNAHLALRQIDQFLKSSRELKLNNPKEFRQLFEPIMTSETRVLVQQLLKKIEDIHKMCEKRMETLQLMVDPHHQPISRPLDQGVVREPRPHREVKEEAPKVNNDFTDNSPLAKKRPEDEKKPTVLLEKSARYHPGNLPSSQVRSNSTSGLSQTRSNSTSGPSQTRSNSTSGSRLPPHVESTADLPSSNLPVMNGQADINAPIGVNTYHSSGPPPRTSTSFPENEGLQTMRKCVMNELTESEEAYVNELHQIIEGYYKKMEDKSLHMMIPPALLGKKNILFGNLFEIYQFHKDVFLQELKDCRDSPSLVGKCFVNRKEEFQMYSTYCQNKPKSEALRMTVDDSNPFFKECQRNLGHRLPLGAYLLKPIQRITKYQLLLKEMLKYTSDNQDMAAGLQEALDTMLSVLAYLNQSMHQVSITGFSENMSNLGLLLMHGSFRVWTEHKHERIRDLRLRPMQRHLFLYQRALLLCKRKDDHHGGHEQPSYTFKNKLNLSQVGLTEKIKTDPRKFELWLRGREEVYIIQSPDLQTKDIWVTEIKKVLKMQFDHIKAYIKAGHQLLPESVSQTSQTSSDSSNVNQENWRSSSVTDPNSSSQTPANSVAYNHHSKGSPIEDNETFDAGWSSGEFSNSDEESPATYIPHIEPSYKEHFVSLGDYFVVDPTELGLAEGDEVEVTRVGTNGWWYARHLRTDQEGWVPSTFLEPVSRAPSLYSSSDSLCIAGSKTEMTRTTSSSFFQNNSPIPETTV